MHHYYLNNESYRKNRIGVNKISVVVNPWYEGCCNISYSYNVAHRFIDISR